MDRRQGFVKESVARTEHACEACDRIIQKGERYLWWKHRGEWDKAIRCLKRECYPRRWELAKGPVRQLAVKVSDGLVAEIDRFQRTGDATRLDYVVERGAGRMLDGVSEFPDHAGVFRNAWRLLDEIHAAMSSGGSDYEAEVGKLKKVALGIGKIGLAR